MSEVRFAVLDIETSGLDLDTNMILEVGCVLLDKELRTVGKYESLINDDHAMREMNRIRELATREEGTTFNAEKEWIDSAKVVWPMHLASGLWSDLATVDYVKDRDAVEEELCDFLYQYGMRPADQDYDKGVEVILTGSSIHFDMDFLGRYMPSIQQHFFHRRMDASAFKVAVDEFKPELRKLREEKLHPVKAHRAIADCYDSVAELAFYLQHVLGVTIREEKE